jgi:hypothetical protein
VNDPHELAVALAAAADTADVLALDAGLRDAEIRHGLIPATAHRPRTVAETRAGVDFAGHARTVEAAATVMLERMIADRLAFLRLVHEQLLTAPSLEAARRLLVDLAAVPGIAGLPAALELARAATAAHGATLHKAAAAGWATAMHDARAQRVPLPAAFADEAPPPDLSAATAAQIDALAARAAAGPFADVARLLREAALVAGTARSRELLAEAVTAAALHGSTAGLATDYARAPAQTAHGMGRNDGIAAIDRIVLEAGGRSRVYASELEDSATCRPCSSIDGTEFDSLDAGLEAYPFGTYDGCRGGARCRGTLVTVFDTETPATV